MLPDEKLYEEKLPRGITRCKDGRLQARYTYNGHRYSIYGRNALELHERMCLEKRNREINGALQREDEQRVNGRGGSDEQPMVRDWYNEWMNEYKYTTVKQGTRDSYKCVYEYYIDPVFGECRLSDVDSRGIQLFYNQMAERGYSRATISLTSVVLGALFTQAVKNGILSANPVKNASIPNMNRRRDRNSLTVEQEELLIKSVTGKQL